MHKFRGSSCFSHTSQSDSVFTLIIICRSFDLYVFINYQKGGEKCIDHRLWERERECCFCSLLLWWLNFICFCLLEILLYACVWYLDDHVFDHMIPLCMLDDIILLYSIWSLTLLGDECMYFNYYHFERSTKMYVTWKSNPWS